MWYIFHFDPLNVFVSCLCLQTLVGGVTGPCVALCASVSVAIKLIILSSKTYRQASSSGVATAKFV